MQKSSQRIDSVLKLSTIESRSLLMKQPNRLHVRGFTKSNLGSSSTVPQVEPAMSSRGRRMMQGHDSTCCVAFWCQIIESFGCGKVGMISCLLIIPVQRSRGSTRLGLNDRAKNSSPANDISTVEHRIARWDSRALSGDSTRRLESSGASVGRDG